MTAWQWCGLAILLVIIGAIVATYIGPGVKIKRDPNRKNDDWPNITQGGSN